MVDRSTASTARSTAPQRTAPARRRARLDGRYFSLSWQRPHPSDAARGALMMAVPKKLVPSAPLRNAVRRVVRESVRAAGIHPMPTGLLRLVALPEFEQTPPASQSSGSQVSAQAHPAVATAAGAAKRAVRAQRNRPFDRRLPDRAFKRACRADADALFARLKLALVQPHR